MINPRQIRIADFDYPLPEERIARHPMEERDEARLLVCRPTGLVSDNFRNLTRYLPASSLIVFNDTRVVEARLRFRKPTGATVEIFCLEPAPEQGGNAAAFASREAVAWKCLVGNASAWPSSLVLEKQLAGGLILYAALLSREEGYFLVRLYWEPKHLSFAEVLKHAGQVPLPPYLGRDAEPGDAERYQTVYASQPGSVAAPTAGLHFTPRLLAELPGKNIRQAFVTLHVGAGTFRPVKSEFLDEHQMHAETIEVGRSFINTLRHQAGSPVIAVGTTSLRTLESLYWTAIKVWHNPDITPDALPVHQWEPYAGQAMEPAPAVALQALLDWMERQELDTLVTRTSLLIAPGYRFRVVNVLVTNFHQPRSTLLLLVAAFIGDSWKSAYTYALENGFRFLSYGDACLMFVQDGPAEPDR